MAAPPATGSRSTRAGRGVVGAIRRTFVGSIRPGVGHAAFHHAVRRRLLTCNGTRASVPIARGVTPAGSAGNGSELDRRAARARRSPQVGGVERRIERLGTKRIQQRVTLLRRCNPQHRAESPGIVIAQHRAVVEYDVDVIVRPRMRASRSEGTGQRNRESYTSIRTTRRPVTCGAIPRRVVSTSGSSGILGTRDRRHAPLAAMKRCRWRL